VNNLSVVRPSSRRILVCSSRGTCTFVELPRASLARRLNSLFVVLVAFFLIRKCLLKIRLHVHVSSLVHGFHKAAGITDTGCERLSLSNLDLVVA